MGFEYRYIKHYLKRLSDGKIICTFSDYMTARTTLFQMGFHDSVHEDDWNQRWWFKGEKYSLIEQDKL